MTHDTGRPRICFVLPSLAGGGAERAAVQILNALDAGTWHRSMYLFRRHGPYLSDLAPDVEVSAGTNQSRWGRWRELRSHLRATRPRIVVSFLSYFTVLTAARMAGIDTRVVFNLQTPMSAFLTDADYEWRHGWRRKLLPLVTRAGYARADLIVATSRGVADDLEACFGVAADAIRVVHNPVDLDAVRMAAAEPLEHEHASQWTSPAIVAAGRLADAKNYPLMIDAMALLRQRVCARLFILGGGEGERAIRDLIAARGLGDAVVLCGFQPNPWRFMARADVFVLTSRYEGFGNVLVEAMACGVPVVATASPGTRDIVRHGDNGLLVESHTPEAVAEALGDVLGSAARRATMAARAHDSASRFSLAAIAAQYNGVFKAVLA